jgi:hypothetical protein
MQSTKEDSTPAITAEPASLAKWFNREENGVSTLHCRRIRVLQCDCRTWRMSVECMSGRRRTHA